MLRFSLTTRGLTADASRPLWQQIDEACEVVEFAAKLGTFDILRAPSHWISHPTIWAEPIPMLARLAPHAGEMSLMTSVLKLPMHHPIDLAHQVATLDHITHGRFILGVGLGYNEAELEAVGTNRKERVARFEECLSVMKELWTGQQVDHEGRFWTVHGRMGYRPLQEPHPPVWNASYSVPAARRAAHMCDGLYVADQATWPSVGELAGEYRAALAEFGLEGRGTVGVNRTFAVAPTYEAARDAAAARAAQSAGYYSRWGMREQTMKDMVLGEEDRDLAEHTIFGTPDDCVAQITKYRDDIGLDFIGLNFANMPGDKSARLDYLQYVSEEVLAKSRGAE